MTPTPGRPAADFGDLDDTFAGWLAEAYAVGRGDHLAAPPDR